MQVRQVSVRNFRGVRSMEWSFDNPIICLIGPGDATKSTVLDAIELALLPYWNLTVDDSDFYEADVGNPIEISVTVGQVPEELFTERKFGLYARGWNRNAGVVDEPGSDDEWVLTVRLRIDESLEPEWDVITDRHEEGRRISSRDRARFGVTRLGGYVDKHLSWRRGSILSRLVSDESNISSVITHLSLK